MFGRRLNLASLVALMVVGAVAMDISDDLASGWQLGLRPRASNANLQTFASALGGVQASAVCDRHFAKDPGEQSDVGLN
jgi:hypothetical protein